MGHERFGYLIMTRFRPYLTTVRDRSLSEVIRLLMSKDHRIGENLLFIESLTAWNQM